MVLHSTKVRNKCGIHCRPAALIAREAKQWADHEITIRIDGKDSVDARNLLGLMSLGIGQGAAVVLEVSGPKEKEVCQRMTTLFETEFDFA